MVKIDMSKYDPRRGRLPIPMEDEMNEQRSATAAIPEPLDTLQTAIENLAEKVATLQESITCSHTKLFGEYNFPPANEAKETVEAVGRIGVLTRNIEGIIRVTNTTREIAESIERKS